MSEEFRKGARAMFDYVTTCTANHYHGNPEIDKFCRAEAAYANELIIAALREVSPEDHNEWLSIVELRQENYRLKEMLNAISGPLIKKDE
jgi:hypothetical protein